MRIVLEKMSSVDGRCYQVKRIKGVKDKSRLPHKYLINPKAVYSGDDKGVYCAGTGKRLLWEDQIISVEYMQDIDFRLHEAGDMLRQINDGIRESLKGWSGEVVLDI